jgi:hypothetical protein
MYFTINSTFAQVPMGEKVKSKRVKVKGQKENVKRQTSGIGLAALTLDV